MVNTTGLQLGPLMFYTPKNKGKLEIHLLPQRLKSQLQFSSILDWFIFILPNPKFLPEVNFIPESHVSSKFFFINNGWNSIFTRQTRGQNQIIKTKREKKTGNRNRTKRDPKVNF